MKNNFWFIVACVLVFFVGYNMNDAAVSLPKYKVAVIDVPEVLSHSSEIQKLKRAQNKEMEELAKQFVGKECIIYTLASNDSYIKGIIKNVADGGMMIDNSGNIEAVNLEFVTRIREYPRNSKGKKKAIIM